MSSDGDTIGVATCKIMVMASRHVKAYPGVDSGKAMALFVEVLTNVGGIYVVEVLASLR